MEDLYKTYDPTNETKSGIGCKFFKYYMDRHSELVKEFYDDGCAEELTQGLQEGKLTQEEYNEALELVSTSYLPDAVDYISF
jgi:hypothetical protein